MEVTLTVPIGTDISAIKYEYEDIYEAEGWEDEGIQVYVIGASSDETRIEEFEWLDYDEAVCFCGFAEGVLSEVEGVYVLIKGNGDWAQGMISRKDFSDLAISEKEKAEYKRISRLYWNSYSRKKMAKLKAIGV